jgi:hypothetical protein
MAGIYEGRPGALGAIDGRLKAGDADLLLSDVADLGGKGLELRGCVARVLGERFDIVGKSADTGSAGRFYGKAQLDFIVGKNSQGESSRNWGKGLDALGRAGAGGQIGNDFRHTFGRQGAHGAQVLPDQIEDYVGVMAKHQANGLPQGAA